MQRQTSRQAPRHPHLRLQAKAAKQLRAVTVYRLLEGTEAQRDTLSEETSVQDDADMERLLSRLLPLLECGTTHSGSTPMPGCHAPDDLRIVQVFRHCRRGVGGIKRVAWQDHTARYFPT